MPDFSNSGPSWNRSKARAGEGPAPKGLMLIGVAAALVAGAAFGLLSGFDPEDLAQGRMAMFGAAAGGAIFKALITAGVVWGAMFLLGLRRADGVESAKVFGMLFVAAFVAITLGTGLRGEYQLRATQFAKATDTVRTGRGSARVNAEVFDAQFRSSGVVDAFSAWRMSRPEGVEIAHSEVQALHRMVAVARAQYAQIRADAVAKVGGAAGDALSQSTKGLQPQVDRYWVLEDQSLNDMDAAATLLGTLHGAWRPPSMFILTPKATDSVGWAATFEFVRPADKTAFDAVVDKIRADQVQLTTLRAAINAREAHDLKDMSGRLF